jgi:hypothetical protein
MINGCVKLALIGRELLERTHAATRAYDGNQIAGLHLLVHKLFQRTPHKVGALK